MRLKFLQSGHNDLGQMALLVTIGDLDRLVEFTFAQRAGHGRSECAALLAGCTESHGPIDHDADGPRGHDEHEDNDRFRERSHLLPKVAEIPSRSSLFLQKHESPYLHL